MFSRFFLSFFLIFHISLLHVPFFTRKTPISENNSLMKPFFTLFVLSQASVRQTLYFTSKNIGGTDAWAVPSPQILGRDRPPSPPRSPPMHVMCPSRSTLILPTPTSELKAQSTF